MTFEQKAQELIHNVHLDYNNFYSKEGKHPTHILMNKIHISLINKYFFGKACDDEGGKFMGLKIVRLMPLDEPKVCILND